MEPTTKRITLKPALFFEWVAPTTPSNSNTEYLGVEIVIGKKSFFAPLPCINPNKTKPLTFTAQHKTKTPQLQHLKINISRKKIHELQLFATHFTAKEGSSEIKEIRHPIGIELPAKLKEQAYYVRIVFQQGVLKAIFEPKEVRHVFNIVSNFVCETMYVSINTCIDSAPPFNFNSKVMTAAFERCSERHLDEERLKSFLQELDTFAPSVLIHGKAACPPIIQLCYNTLGKENMRTLMHLLIQTSYPPATLPEVLKIFPKAFSLFACLHDPTEMNAENSKHILKYCKSMIDPSRNKTAP